MKIQTQYKRMPLNDTGGSYMDEDPGGLTGFLRRSANQVQSTVSSGKWASAAITGIAAGLGVWAAKNLGLQDQVE